MKSIDISVQTSSEIANDWRRLEDAIAHTQQKIV